jgi:hypothetical protein
MQHGKKFSEVKARIESMSGVCGKAGALSPSRLEFDLYLTPIGPELRGLAWMTIVHPV